jgi:ubiquinone/menaquinone biosynthesis C-methylase UbiE
MGRIMSTAADDPTSFDHLAGHHDRLVALTSAPLAAYLTACLPVERGGRAVDLGCGTGRHAALLAQRFDEVLAVDISEPMLSLARRHRPVGNIRYEHRDLHDVTPERDGRFDLVLTTYTLHHTPDLPRALRHVRGLVAAGGQAVLVDVCDRPRPADWFRREALRTLLADLRGPQRTVQAACELYRLSTDPAWLAHQTCDRPLPPGDFERAYLQVFPGAVITELHRARAVLWHHPGPAEGRAIP